MKVQSLFGISICELSFISRAGSMQLTSQGSTIGVRESFPLSEGANGPDTRPFLVLGSGFGY